jgi:hypothetical protein
VGVKHMGLFLSKDRESKNIRSGVGGVGGGFDRLGRGDGVEGKGGKCFDKKKRLVH